MCSAKVAISVSRQQLNGLLVLQRTSAYSMSITRCGVCTMIADVQNVEFIAV